MELRGTVIVSLAAVVVFVDCSSNTCADITKFQSVKQNTFIIGTRFFTLHNQTLLGCAKQCLLRSDCQSINFELATGICELNKKSSADTVPPNEITDTKPGIVTSDRTSISTVIAGVCSTDCGGNSVCVIQSNGTAFCKVECQDPIFTNGTITSGISHDIGSVLTIQCDPGFLLFGEAECQVNGTWTSFSCEQGCVNPPSVVDGNLVSTGNVWAIGSVLEYSCSGSKVQLGKVECKSDLSWTELRCITPVHSCMNLKSCGNNPDGEYWLVPDSISRPVKIFCYGMSSASPKEFLTLPEENYVDYSDVGCDPRYTERDHTFASCVSTSFQRLRISEFVSLKTTRTEGLKDYTFINTPRHCYYIQFGSVADCHAHTDCNQQKTRDFVINTKGTGLKVDPTQQWSAQDSSTTLLDPFNVSKTDSGRHITVKCHQSCGWCFPMFDTYTFVIDEELPADTDSATVPVC